MIMLKLPLYLNEASDKTYTAAAAKQRQNNAEEVQKMSRIPTLNVERAEPRHPEKVRAKQPQRKNVITNLTQFLRYT